MAVLVTEVRAGDVVRLEGALCKVLAMNMHMGSGRSGAMVHIKIRNLESGSTIEKRLATSDKLETLPTERIHMQYLYTENDLAYFMNPDTYEQISLKKQVIGGAGLFLKEEDKVSLEMFDGKPITVDFPAIVEARVASTGAGLRGQGDSSYKEATLDNGLTLMVPQFIKDGDIVRVEVETQKYVDRVRKEVTK